jgi:putative alpha-1,2-mannosidase
MIGVRIDRGGTIPVPTLPHGSIHPSPNTLIGSNSGYHPQAEISGFAQLHAQGTGGRTTYGTFLVSPQVGEPEFDERKHLSGKRDEQAQAHPYAVTLDRRQTIVEQETHTEISLELLAHIPEAALHQLVGFAQARPSIRPEKHSMALRIAISALSASKRVK